MWIYAIFAALLWSLVWSASGFSIRGNNLADVLVLWLIMYVPLLAANLLFHKHHGWLRNSERAETIGAAIVFLVWFCSVLLMIAVAFEEYGLLGLLGVPVPIVFWTGLFYLVLNGVTGRDT